MFEAFQFRTALKKESLISFFIIRLEVRARKFEALLALLGKSKTPLLLKVF